MNFYKGKKVLVTGGTGLIGRPLVKLLLDKKAKVTVASLDSPNNLPKNCKFIKVDLREFSNCIKICNNQDYVFNLIGIKGSPKMAVQKPSSFMVPTIMFSTNMIEAARICKVKRFLFTSSIGVYAPKKIFLEDDVWKSFPSKNDRFAGWAKRICELQIESYKVQYNLENFLIVRPANVYGPGDNFDPNNAMVIPSLINRVMSGENPLRVWGDGSAIRDFIYSEDVAEAMLKIFEKNYKKPINIGSGTGVNIKDLVDTIIKISQEEYFKNHKPIKVIWDKTKPVGDKFRVMSTSRAKLLNIKIKTNLSEGIRKTIVWYLKNKKDINNRFNSFK